MSESYESRSYELRHAKLEDVIVDLSSVLLAWKSLRAGRWNGNNYVDCGSAGVKRGWRGEEDRRGPCKISFPARIRRASSCGPSHDHFASFTKQTDWRTPLPRIFSTCRMCQHLMSAWLSRERSCQASPISTCCAYKIARGAQQVYHCSKTSRRIKSSFTRESESFVTGTLRLAERAKMSHTWWHCDVWKKKKKNKKNTRRGNARNVCTQCLVKSCFKLTRVSINTTHVHACVRVCVCVHWERNIWYL